MISQVTFSQIYIRSNETRYNDWKSFVAWVKKQGGKAYRKRLQRRFNGTRFDEIHY